MASLSVTYTFKFMLAHTSKSSHYNQNILLTMWGCDAMGRKEGENESVELVITPKMQF